jgi:hypothetical protein
MTHEMLKRLVSRGHQVTVVTKDPTDPYVWDGIQVTHGVVPDGDILVYHPDYPDVAVGWSGPKVGICHNYRLGVQLGVRNTMPDLLTCNSNNTAKQVPYFRKLVVHPPVSVPPKRPALTPKRNRITVVNMEVTNKVGPFWNIVRAMPEELFLGVKGGYGRQSIPKRTKPNVEILEHVPPGLMKKHVWDRTKILLVPSASESWSMVASEAMAHGVPVIANNLPGLWENMNGVAVWANRDNPEEWVDAIRLTNNSWDDFSTAVYERALQQQATFNREVDLWCETLENLC